MNNEQYHAHPALSASGLKLLQKSPLHYWAEYLDPNRPERVATNAQRIGTMVHTATLEPHLFDEQFTVLPEGLDLSLIHI